MKNKIILLIIGVVLIGVIIISSIEDKDTEVLATEGNIIISEVIPKNSSLYADSQGEYLDIIELYNPLNIKVDLKGMGLSDDPSKPHLWTFGSGEIKPGEYLLVYAAGIKDKHELDLNGFYTNFKLKADGERVSLADANGDIISIVSYSGLDNNMSIALIDDEYQYMYEGTPGEANSGIEITDINEYNQELVLRASHDSGIYKEAFELKFEAYSSYELRYTLDGSDPSNQSLLYESKIDMDFSNKNKTLIANEKSTFQNVDKVRDKFVNKGTVVKARYYRDGVPFGDMFVGTYFVWEEADDRYSFDTISLTTDPSNLYDPVSGIHVVGDKYLKQAPIKPDGGTPANYNQRGREWEREANIEFFDSDGTMYYSDSIGIRIFGGWSRANTKKSFKLFARSDYGETRFEYPFFDNMLDVNGELIDSFDRLLLRTGGNDGEYAMIRDPLADSLVDGMLDYQQYKQVILFLNGEYWGIYHLREHMDEEYVASHYDIKSKDVNIIAYNPAGLESYAGDEDELDRYEEFMEFVDSNDISIEENYEYVKEMIDIDNFIDYYITQMFINNVDWPSNNSKVWRYVGDDEDQVVSDGRYRYLLYDTEFSFGLYEGPSATNHNYFEFLHADTDAIWPNPKWSTSFYRNFMENNDFRERFIVRFTDLLNSRFDRDLVIERIDEMKELYKPEMEEYLERWNFWAVKDINAWEVDQIYILKEFTDKRSSYLLNYAQTQYELGAIRQVKVEPFEGGSVQVNNNYELRFSDTRQATINPHVKGEKPLFTLVKDTTNVLEYYSDYNLNIQIKVDEGYKFVEWKIETNATNGLGSIIISGDISQEELELQLEGNVTLTPVIEKVVN